MNYTLLWFVFIGLFSPGPNVIMLVNSGAIFGFQRSLPHLLGVVFGVGIIGLAVGAGLGGLLNLFPVLENILRGFAVIWILWMAYAFLRAAITEQKKDPRPMRFHEAILFQWINPKIWAVSIAALAFLDRSAPIEQALLLGATLSGVNLFVCLFWTQFGQLLSGLLNSQNHWQKFRVSMSILLGLSALPLVIE